MPGGITRSRAGRQKREGTHVMSNDPSTPESNPSTPAESPAFPAQPEGAASTPLASNVPAVVAGGQRWLIPVLAGVAGLVVGVAATAGVSLSIDAANAREADAAASAAAEAEAEAEAAKLAILGDAVETCGVANATGFLMGDGGTSLTFDMKGDDQLTGANILDIYCVLGELAIPASVSSHMGQTTSMDGRQSATWDNLEISWSYHPDRGMDGVVTVVGS